MSFINYRKLKDHITQNPEAFLRGMGYQGEVVSGQFVTGDIQGKPGNSFHIHLEKALFNDLNDSANESSGKGWINLIAKKMSLTSKDAAEYIIEVMSWDRSGFLQADATPKGKLGDPIMPVPEDATEIPYSIGEALKFESDFKLTETYPYRDEEGNLLHYVLRFEALMLREVNPKRKYAL